MQARRTIAEKLVDSFSYLVEMRRFSLSQELHRSITFLSLYLVASNPSWFFSFFLYLITLLMLRFLHAFLLVWELYPASAHTTNARFLRPASAKVPDFDSVKHVLKQDRVIHVSRTEKKREWDARGAHDEMNLGAPTLGAVPQISMSWLTMPVFLRSDTRPQQPW